MLQNLSHRGRLKIVLVIVIGLLLLVSGLAYYQNRQPSGGVSSSQTLSSSSSGVTSTPLLALSGKMSLGATQGRIDHMAIDLKRGLLFVGALGNNSVGVVDIRSGQLIRAITGLDSPQGVIFAPDSGKLYVSNAGDGTLSVFDSRTFALLEKISFPGGDADNLRLDTVNKLLYVGYGSGGIAKVDTTSDKITHEFPVPGHPESFQIQVHGQLIYVNVPTANIVEAINSSTGRSLFNYTLSPNSENFPMALDEANGRLFIGTRSPSELVVLDTSTWKAVASVSIPGDPDDIYYDAARGLVYVSCGQGSLEVIQQVDANDYSLAQTIPTGPGARTSLFVPELGSIYVAVPESLGQQAELLVYSTSVSTGSTSSSSLSSGSSGPSSASLSLDRFSGPTGTVVALSGGGYGPGSRYQVCVGTVGKAACGFSYVGSGYLSSIGGFAVLGNFTAGSDGGIPPGTYATIPDLFGGSYVVAVVTYGGSGFVASTSFDVTPPSLSISSSEGLAGTGVTLTGGNYNAGTTYTVCLVLQGYVDCGYSGDREETPPGTYIGTFTADSDGNIPMGTLAAIPAAQPPGQYAVGVFIPSGGFILISTAAFTLDSPT